MNFPNYTFTKDEDGNDLLLKDGIYQVMMAWEKPYMEACIQELNPHGDVLEIGFGLGYSATAIQSFPIRSHTIIEYHPTVFEKAQYWADGKKGVMLIEDTWQSALKDLGVFDAIFFDDYPLETKEEHSAIAALSEKNTKYLNATYSIPYTQVSREELLVFFDSLESGEMPIADPKYLYSFLSNLVHEHSISEEDKDWAVAYAKKRHLLFDEDCTTTPPKIPRNNDRLYTFLQMCLENHMRKGSRFSCYLESSHSRFDDPYFFNEIILNPHLTYTEKKMHVAPPEHCAYYMEKEALLITIEKW